MKLRISRNHYVNTEVPFSKSRNEKPWSDGSLDHFERGFRLDLVISS